MRISLYFLSIVCFTAIDIFYKKPARRPEKVNLILKFLILYIIIVATHSNDSIKNVNNVICAVVALNINSY